MDRAGSLNGPTGPVRLAFQGGAPRLTRGRRLKLLGELHGGGVQDVSALVWA